MFGQNNNKFVIRMYKEVVKPYKFIALIAIFAMIISACLQSFLVWLINPIVESIVAKDQQMLFNLSAILILCFFVKGIAEYINTLFLNNTGLKIVRNLQNTLYNHLIYLDIKFFKSNQSGDLLCRFTVDLEKIRNGIITAVIGIVKEGVVVIGLISIILYQSPKLSIITLTIIFLTSMPIKKLGKILKGQSIKFQKAMGNLGANISQSFNNIHLIKYFNLEPQEVNKISQIIDKIYHISFGLIKKEALLGPIAEFLGGVNIFLILVYSGYNVINDYMTLGQFTSFLAALFMIQRPIKRIAKLNSPLQEAYSGLIRLFNILDIKADIKESANPKKFVNGDIIFDNVYFQHNNNKKYIIEDINLKIDKGSSIALIGLSGTGKSTITDLILRLYDVGSGSISINGTDIRNIKQNELRNNISVVSQNAELFSTSIKDNIRLGNSAASDAEIIHACKLANVHDFIMSMPDQYDSIIGGDQGIKLSGGQNQRISIARAILKNASIIILDEITSALDIENENLIYNSIQELKKDKTTIIISHKFKLIRDCAQIYLLDNGQIVEQGSHEKLINLNQKYKNLHDLQKY